MVERRQVLKGFNNREPWKSRCSKIMVRVHLQTEYMKHKRITYGLIQNKMNRSQKIALTKETIKQYIRRKNIYLNIPVHIHNINDFTCIHNKTVHLQLLPAPLIIGTAGRGTCGLPLIGDIVLDIQHTVSVCASRVGPSYSQRQALVQQHRVDNRPTINGQLGQFTIVRSSVHKPQGIMPGRIGSWQPFKGM
jgi:hypothetical protein